MDVRIELRKHIGIGSSPLGPIEIEHDQWIVVAQLGANPAKQIGYLPHRDGAPFLWNPYVRDELPEALQRDIEAAVAAERERVVNGGE